MSNSLDRRSLFGLGAGALVLAPAVPLLLGGCRNGPEQEASTAAGNKAENEAHDVQLLNDGILLEQGAINVYTAAAGLPFIASDPAVIGVARLFMGQHEEHRDTLARWVRTLGGTPVDPGTAPTPAIPGEILDESLEDGLRKLAVLEFARKLERQAADTYFQLLVQMLRTDVARRAAAEILPVEAQHVAVYDLVLQRAAPVNAALFSEQT
jgi:rubrerythrin